MIRPEDEARPEPPRPRWWSLRRAYVPLGVLVAIAGAMTFVALEIVDERDRLRAEAADLAAESRQIELGIEAATTQLSGQERGLREQRRIAEDCIEASRLGVRFLHGAVRWMGLVAANEPSAAEEERHEVNRLIEDANAASRRCRRGLA